MIGILSAYVARRFLSTFAAAFVIVFLLVMLVDSVELLRAAANTDAGWEEVIYLSLLHAPSLLLTILPFLALLAAMASFARLARASELVVTRAAGVSVWRLIAPTLAAAAVLGGLAFAVYNPVASATLQRYETLRQKWFSGDDSLLSVSSNGLWLREGDASGQMVFRAKRAGAGGDQLWDVSVFRYDRDDRLIARIEAGRAVLEEGAWRLHQVRSWRFDAPQAGNAAGAGEGAADGAPDGGENGNGDGNRGRDGGAAPPPGAAAWGGPPPETQLDGMTLPTRLTRARILESFASPETISFWKLPAFIDTMEESGFSAARHRMHWQSQLSTPLLLAAMVLIGAAFSMRHVRFGGLGLMALGAVATGLGYFVLANVAQAFGAQGSIPAPFAAWGPPAAMSLLAIGLLLHLEDG